MRLTTFTISAISLGLAFAATPAAGQAVGMQIVDTTGATVGTVAAIKGDNVLVKTDKHEALLPKASFTLDKGKLLFGMTQAQLDAQIEAAAAASQKAIVAGATVNGTGGTAVGKIDSVDNGNVTITLNSGKKIQVPSTGLRGNADGTVTIGYTADQLEALINGTTTTPGASPSGSSSGK
jgi:preprotein translocase subunit YajC